jgi:hypothetical protein
MGGPALQPARYDADKTVFAAQLKDAVDLGSVRGDLGSVRGDLAAVVQVAPEPARISMWISREG